MISAITPSTTSAESILDELRESLTTSLMNIWEGAVALFPNLVIAVVILMIGGIVSVGLRWLARFILRRARFDSLCERTGLTEMSQAVGLSNAPSFMLGQLVFFGTIFMFFKVAVDVLGLDDLSKAVESLIAYLPNVIGAMVILIVGLVIANFVRGAVQTAAERIGLEYGKALGGAVFGAFLIVIGTMVVGQLKLETDLVNRTIEIVLMAGGAAIAIALGLGTRDAARQIVAGMYARESFKPGKSITVGDLQGEVLSVEKVNTRLLAADGGIIVIPNAELIESRVQEQA